MSENSPKSHAQPDELVALLCVSDVAGPNGEAPLALTPLYGQPFLHHLVKSLEGIGIKRFFIGIDAVPGALLAYGDMAKRQGLDVQFVRNPSDLASQIDDNVRILVQSADIIWEQALVGKAIDHQKPIVATVEEQAENQRFERIDLNSRWGGLAILERRSAAALTSLPEGWDMGSALLRQALQDGVVRWPVSQKNVQAGLVCKLDQADEVSAAMPIFAQPGENAPNSLEKVIFSPLVNRLLPNIWTAPWSRALIEWLFPGLAALSALLAGLAVPSAAALFAFIAIFAALVRKQARILEYRSGRPDWFSKAGWALLALSMGATLYHAELSRPEGGFVSLAMIATSIFARNYWRTKSFWLSSPLVIAISASIGQAAGMPGWAIRGLILAELASLLLSQLTSGHRNVAATEQA
jgi:hypothetical protein